MYCVDRLHHQKYISHSVSQLQGDLTLKDALGGNTTTCIIATVSPENACSHETCVHCLLLSVVEISI